MSRKIYCISNCLLLLFALFAESHEQHKKPQSNIAPRQEQTRELATTPTSAAPQEKPIPTPLPFSGDLKAHAHNKLVHFPLAFGIAGVLFVFVSLKKPEMLNAVRILWFVAAVGAVGAYFTGEAQEEPFEDDAALHEVVELHEKLGIASGISLGIGFLISLSRRLKGLSVVWSIVVLLLLSVTGYYGGLLAHQ